MTVSAIVGELPLLTVTGRVALAVCPFMVTEAVSVRAPSGIWVVSHVYHSVVPGRFCVVSTVPSTDSVNDFATPQVAVVASPTDCAPSTLAPRLGWLNDTVKPAVGGGGVPFDTVTVRDAVAVAFAESVAVAVSVCDPFATDVVLQVKLGFVPAYMIVPSTVIL